MARFICSIVKNVILKVIFDESLFNDFKFRVEDCFGGVYKFGAIC